MMTITLQPEASKLLTDLTETDKQKSRKQELFVMEEKHLLYIFTDWVRSTVVMVWRLWRAVTEGKWMACLLIYLAKPTKSIHNDSSEFHTVTCVWSYIASQISYMAFTHTYTHTYTHTHTHTHTHTYIYIYIYIYMSVICRWMIKRTLFCTKYVYF